MERTHAVVALYEKAREIAASFDYELVERRSAARPTQFRRALGVPVLDGLGIAGDGAHTLHEYFGERYSKAFGDGNLASKTLMDEKGADQGSSSSASGMPRSEESRILRLLI